VDPDASYLQGKKVHRKRRTSIQTIDHQESQ